MKTYTCMTHRYLYLYDTQVDRYTYIPGVSNLFDCRAKCTNFKLVGGQTTELQRRDRDAEGVEGEGNGEVVSPSPAESGSGEHRKLPSRVRAEPQQKMSFGVF